jgi:dTDP-4-dehydrorhamnose reductase
VKILVTGHGGQLGRALAARMGRRSDLELVGLGRTDLDLEVPGSATRALSRVKPDIVINCAAFTAVDDAEREEGRAFRINAAGAGEVARAARLAGARFVHISTDHVFDGGAASPYAVDAPTRPINVYGRSKLAGEEQVRLEQPDHLILRTAWLFASAGTNFVTRILGAAAGGEALRIVSDQYGSPTAAGDVAAGLLRIVDVWRTGGPACLGETMHLVNGGEASRFELAEAVLRQATRFGWPMTQLDPVSSADRPSIARRPARSTLDNSRFVRAFGFPMAPWQDAVKRVVGEIAAATSRTRI